MYRKLAKQLVGATKRPVDLVDWSDIDARRKFFLLRAAIAVRGRSLTIYEEIHGVSTKEEPCTHRAFLTRLKEILPAGCVAIIVTDAGYRGSWFKQVRALGWHFVGRVRNRTMVNFAKNSNWIGAKSLYPQATRKPVLLKHAVLARSNPTRCHLILFKAKQKGRVRRGKMGKLARYRTSLVSSRRAREPWLLATSLPVTALKVVKIYSSRMQIEESFRDLKCSRNGMGLYYNNTYKIERMRVLVMIGSIAATFAWLLGKATRSTGRHLQFQANSIKKTAALSKVFLGILVFRDIQYEVSKENFQLAKQLVSAIVQENSLLGST